VKTEAEVQAGVYRLRCNEWWKPRPLCYRHANMSWDTGKKHILQIGTDKTIPRYAFNKIFRVRFPDRSEGEDGFGSADMEN
jgi:hypothetical protein